MRTGLLLFILFWAGNAAARSAGNSGRPAEHFGEHRTQIPEWFLFPGENEYVGVSVPSSSPEERICSALASALLAYEAQISRPSATNRLVESGSDGIRGDILRGERKIDDNISSRIVRQFVNENGELFIALQITQDGSEHLQLAVAKTVSLQKDDGTTSWKCEEIIECRYPELGYYCFRREEKNREVRNSLETAYENRYRHVKELPESEYADIRNSIEELGWHYDCHDSLYAAYVRALCTFIVKGVTLKYPCSLIDNRLIFYAYD